MAGRIAVLCASDQTPTQKKWRDKIVAPFVGAEAFDGYELTLVDEHWKAEGKPELGEGVAAFAAALPTDHFDVVVSEYCPLAEATGNWVADIVQAHVKILKERLKPGGMFFMSAKVLKMAPSLARFLDDSNAFVRIDEHASTHAAMFVKLTVAGEFEDHHGGSAA